ncbi:Protein RCC2 [Sciurus carolinensis]|uniref:Protein RCC2 n=1 Tax=Sciurus carolinensis TaxID=30640 RepID=A0AA41SQN0_SCICA|nr:Protein RCC2 [Sciurus carolinensis]
MNQNEDANVFDSCQTSLHALQFVKHNGSSKSSEHRDHAQEEGGGGLRRAEFPQQHGLRGAQEAQRPALQQQQPRRQQRRRGGLELHGDPGGGKHAARQAVGKAGSTVVVITEPKHTKERVKLEGSKCKGQLLILGTTSWDLIGWKEVPKQQVGYHNIGQNLWGPHKYGCPSGIQVRTVDSGSYAAHSLLITTEGKLWSWSRNEKGQLDHGDTKRVEGPRLIEALTHEAIVSAACGRNHTLALTKTGSVFAFGENKMEKLGLGNQTDAIPSPAQIMYNHQSITKMACGTEFIGTQLEWEVHHRMQRIEYDLELVPRWVAIFIEKTKDGQILPVSNVVVCDVAGGANHTLVPDSQKRVFSWRFGGYGRLGHAEQKDEMMPRPHLLITGGHELLTLPGDRAGRERDGEGEAEVPARVTCTPSEAASQPLVAAAFSTCSGTGSQMRNSKQRWPKVHF